MITPDHAANTAATVSGGAAILGMTIGEINQYLQAGAFVVAMGSGVCAALYYIVKTWVAIKQRKDKD